MQSLAGNKYVPCLGQIGCESDGRSVIKFHNFRIDFLFRLLEPGREKTQFGHPAHVFSIFASLQLLSMPTGVAHIEPYHLLILFAREMSLIC